MQRVVLFDGVCNLCNSSIQTLIKLDKQERLKFASLQSEFGQKVLRESGMDTANFNSFIYLRGKIIYTQSTAAIEVFFDLGGFWKVSRAFYIIPKFIRNAVYAFISKNRYRWFGKKDNCWLPTPELQQRFLQ